MTPLTDVLFEVGPNLYFELAAADGLLASVTTRIEASAGAMVDQLGFLSRVRAKIRTLQTPPPSFRPLTVTVNGTPGVCSDCVLREAEAFARRLDGRGGEEDDFASWLTHAVRSNNAQPLADFFAHVAGGILERQPELLLTGAVLGDVERTLFGSQDIRQEQRAMLPEVIRLLTRAGVSVAGANTSLAFLLDASDAGAVAEHAITTLSPENVQIRMPGSYLRELTFASAMDALSKTRTRFLDELGIPFPPVCFVEDDELAPKCFGFRLRSINSQPRCGFGSCERFIAHGAFGLDDYSRSNSVIDPRTCVTGWVVPASDAERLSLDGQSLAPLEFIAECLSSFLRERAPRLIDQRLVGDLLDRFNVFPHLAGEVRKRVPTWIATGVLRALVAEGSSLRDLADILEAFLDGLYVISPTVQVAVLGDLSPLGTRSTAGNTVDDWIRVVRQRLQHPLPIQYDAPAAV